MDNSDEPSLVTALKGNDVFVITLGVRSPPGTHAKLVNAASKAGVPWIMPNLYGWDILNTKLLSETPYGQSVMATVAEAENSSASWVAMVCGYWYEWSLATGEQWFGFDFKNKKVTFYDDGKTRIDVSTWLQCGRALAALLSLPVRKEGNQIALDDFKNKPMYISSFKVSQRDMLDSIHRVTGDTDTDWKILYKNTDQRFKDGQEEMKNGDFKGFAKSMYARSFMNGDGEFESKRGLDNEKLGLPKEDLDEATERTLNMVKNGWNPLGE